MIKKRFQANHPIPIMKFPVCLKIAIGNTRQAQECLKMIMKVLREKSIIRNRGLNRLAN